MEVRLETDSHRDGMSLEDRLRGFILSNAHHPKPENSTAAGPESSQVRVSAESACPQGESSLPNDRPVGGRAEPAKIIHGSKPTRKRPNQAQRRQMSAQLSIPIDPRPQQYSSRPPPDTFRDQLHHQRPATQQHTSQQPQSSVARQWPTSRGIPGQHPSSAPHHRHSPSYPGSYSPVGLYDWRQPMDRQNGFQGIQNPPTASTDQPKRSNDPWLYPRPYNVRPEELKSQVALLEGLSANIIANAEIETAQIVEKEEFRLMIQDICRDVIVRYERDANGLADLPPMSVQLKCFGSLVSGFATKASDMDLGLLSPFSHPQPDSNESPIPRLIEKAFLDHGLGARLLTKTRVPIIKLCQRPCAKLYSDLVEERAKWEKGLDEDQEDEEEDFQDGHPLSPIDSVEPSNEIKSCAKSSNLAETHDGDDYQQLLDNFKQGEKIQLPAYYRAAKRLLRRLGGRDIKHGTSSNFTTEDFRILNDACKAFVRGLASNDLRSRLEAYTSLSFDPSSPVPSNRSLFGVFTQAEGEEMVMAWETREIQEKNEYQELLGEKRVRYWKDLQNKPTYGLDPLAYNKELLSSVDLLKKISSVELLTMEQRQHESATQYHGRAIRLMINLGGHDFLSSTSPTLSAVIKHYIHGISNQEIRAQVTEFADSVQHPSLRAVARRHKSLQLAREFERALDKGSYPVECVDDICSYIRSLREPMVVAQPRSGHFDYMLPMTPDTRKLLDKIRKLPDPSHAPVNQPRDPYRDKLEFPKSGAGVQCDINFSAHLGLQNTHLLRCYSLTDPRVRPIVLFIKHWAKVRGINTPYRGSLSSYGYVLMVLHYLVNVARPPVCPNLQELAPPVDPNLSPQQIQETVICKGRDIRFWRDEHEISKCVNEGSLTQNRESLGHLLRGLFEYYAQSNLVGAGHMHGFDWGRNVLSLRTHGGILSKQEKGWTEAKTVFEVQPKSAPPPALEPGSLQANPKSPTEQHSSDRLTVPPPDSASASRSLQERAKAGEVKEVRHRYLFAIEDPFELDHNVARTVTHNGIVSIRDEFRRAWRIIRNAGKGSVQEDLLQDVTKIQKKAGERGAFSELLDEIHGRGHHLPGTTQAP